MNIKEHVKEKIVKYGLIPRGGHVVVGLSGGPDSVCLFHVLHGLQNELHFTLSAAHLNHRFRPGSAEEDAAYVQKLCDEYKVKLTLQTVDVPKAAAQNNQTPEEAGRIARYTLFAEVCHCEEPCVGAQDRLRDAAIPLPLISPRIAVAHHADDQAETLLMRILRGTGTDGLAGMQLRRTDESGFEIIRPLLHVRRNEIEDYCQANGLTPRHDHTNDDATYTRNKIRLELLPLMDECSGGIAVRSLSRLADHAGEDKDYFDSLIEDIIQESCEFSTVEFSGGHTPAGNVPLCNSVSAKIPLTVLSDNHPAIVHRLITTIFAKLGLVQDITTAHIEAAYNLISTARTGSSIDFPGNYKLEISYEKAEFIKGASLRPPSRNPATNEQATGTFPEGVCTQVSSSNSPSAITFDEDALKSANLNPVWRKWRPGDIMHLNGMSGSKKLQDIFTDMKIPKNERDEIMILADETGNEVLWIPEIRATRLYLPTPETKHTRIIASPCGIEK
jgi:tRNA(Ile)-lysidine synthase